MTSWTRPLYILIKGRHQRGLSLTLVDYYHMTFSFSKHAPTYNKMRKLKYAEPNINPTKKCQNGLYIYHLTFAGLSLVNIYSKVNAVPYLHKKGGNFH